jgi:hypothetical protein
MAKNSDRRAGDYQTENTGGVLSGLLADEEHLDRRAMFRLGSWGAASVGAVIVAVLANQSGMKSRHDEIAALDLTRQSQQIQSVAKESQNETRRLASAIDTLNGDRDRLYSRLTTLEQGLESVTGTIAKQSVVAPPPATPPVTPAAPAAISQPVAQTATPEPAPAVAPVATSVAPVTTSVAPVTTSVAPVTTTATATPTAEKTATEKPRADAKKPAPSAAAPVAAAAPSSPAAATVAAAPPAPAPSNPPATTSAEPLMASKSLMSPPDAAAGKLIEPEPSAKTAAVTPPAPAPMMTPTPAPMTPAPDAAASAPAADKVAAAEPASSAPPPLAVKRTEFGVDVGGANSVGGLRALWRGLLKWRSSAALAALQPIIVVKEGNNGLGMQLRLVAGPLTDAAAAAKICASMTANDRHCETTVFDGQRLAMAADEAPTTTESISAKPSSEKSSSDPASDKSASDKSSAKPGSTRQSSHRRGYSYAKRTPTEEPPKPAPPPPSTLSWFHLRSQ